MRSAEDEAKTRKRRDLRNETGKLQMCGGWKDENDSVADYVNSWIVEEITE